MIKLGQHQELAEALKKKRGTRSRKSVAKEIGISEATLKKLEDCSGNTYYQSQYLARKWVNGV